MEREGVVLSLISLSHGSGGELTHQLIDRVFMSKLGNPILAEMDDAARLRDSYCDWCFTTDSFVVKPLFFPGGDIGRLAVCGTVNDLCVAGAVPAFLSAGFIIEEGFETRRLHDVVDSMKEAALESGVQVVAGDTKVVEKGAADGLYINTAGIGKIPPGRKISASMARPGDAIIVSGTVGQHGAAVMLARGEMSFRGRIESDVNPLRALTNALLNACPEIHVMRDPTRGGLATVLNEIARQSAVSMLINEQSIPVSSEVDSICQLLGLDPLYLACEGRVVIFLPAPLASKALETLRRLPAGRKAAIIGEVSGRAQRWDGGAGWQGAGRQVGQVVLKTTAGGYRPLPMLAGEPIPRIC
ncbi:MAG TPA: hydrogenase expression/formation protein HypE [Firmicutes bacterium]|nr:hydrogenase expression/formation protein HypE [Bacillota bacterium]